jgi:hypothetical protein
MNTLNLSQAFIDGSILSVVVGVIIMASLVYNARMWLHDYPKEIQARVAPLTAAEKRDRNVLVVLFMTALIGIILYAVLQLRSTGRVPFATAYAHVFIMLFMFNLMDALVIDFLILTLMRPKFVILEGMEGLEHILFNYKKQVVDFFKGIVFCMVFSVPFAIIAAL